MLTRCPSCATTFRVTPEQLKVRLGRVRCGQCQTVFNALDGLVEEGAGLPPVSVPATADSVPAPSPSNAPIAAVEPASAADDAPPAMTADTSALAEAAETAPTDTVVEAVAPIEESEAPADAAGASDADEQDTPAAAEDTEDTELASLDFLDLTETPAVDASPAVLEAAPTPAADTVAEIGAAADAEPVDDAAENDPAPTPAEASPDTDTAPAAETPLTPEVEDDPAATDAPQADDAPIVADAAEADTAPSAAIPPPDPLLHKEARPPRRWPWIVGIVLATLTLTLQLSLLYRVELSVLAPGLKPALEALCRPLDCTVPLPHKIDLLSIESSDLHPAARKGQLQLVAVLKNKAPYAQEFPLLEITLTDTADRVLVVKALGPRDYLGKEFPPEAGFPARKEINIELMLDAGDVPAAGYRLYLYHP
ncbi:DUF3426 domain-containing protein [Denitratisoma sp. agr-D3]